MSVFRQSLDVTLHLGDVRECLRELPADSVHCVVTSPPYWGLRRYDCEDQLGLEPTLSEFVANLVNVFREVRRVLHPSGTVWVNLGDSFAARQLNLAPERLAIALQEDGWWIRSRIAWCKVNCMPESVDDRPTNAWEHIWLLAKQRDYYYDAEAVKDKAINVGKFVKPYRPTSAILSSGDAINDRRTAKGISKEGRIVAPGRNLRNWWALPSEPSLYDYCQTCDVLFTGAARNHIRTTAKPEAPHLDSWRVCTDHHQESPPERICPHCDRSDGWVNHYAAFPREIVRRAVLAGTSEMGCCAECGAPRERIVESTLCPQYDSRHGGYHAKGNSNGMVDMSKIWTPGSKKTTTLGWRPTCPHGAPSVPCVVLDPFVGSGTTCLVARALGRHSIGIDLSEPYLWLAAARLRARETFWQLDTPTPTAQEPEQLEMVIAETEEASRD